MSNILESVQAANYAQGLFTYAEFTMMKDINCVYFARCFFNESFRSLLHDLGLQDLSIEQITLDLDAGIYHLETFNGDELGRIPAHKVFWYNST